MRHYVAVQDDKGRWFYANEGRHRETGAYGWMPVGACGKWMPCTDPDCKGFTNYTGREPTDADCKTCGGSAVVENPAPCQGHASAEEAYEHHRQRRLDTELRFYPDREGAKSQHLCEAPACTVYTSGVAYVGSYFHKHLCETHRTREVVEPMFFVGESWES